MSISLKSLCLAMTILTAAGPLAAGPDSSGPATDKPKDAAAEPKKETYLGVVSGKIPDVLRSQMPTLFPDGQGLLVVRVLENSPAAKAGIQQHDIIMTVGAEKLTGIEQLEKLVRQQSAGSDFQLGVIRHGKAESIIARLEERQHPVRFTKPIFEKHFNIKLDGPNAGDGAALVEHNARMAEHQARLAAAREKAERAIKEAQEKHRAAMKRVEEETGKSVKRAVEMKNASGRVSISKLSDATPKVTIEIIDEKGNRTKYDFESKIEDMKQKIKELENLQKQLTPELQKNLQKAFDGVQQGPLTWTAPAPGVNGNFVMQLKPFLSAAVDFDDDDILALNDDDFFLFAGIPGDSVHIRPIEIEGNMDVQVIIDQLDGLPADTKEQIEKILRRVNLPEKKKSVEQSQ